jgi:hypothetical protein
MSFLSFLLLAGATYLIWRITDQLPDLVFRISEIQRDVAELRRAMDDSRDSNPSVQTAPRASDESPSSA